MAHEYRKTTSKFDHTRRVKTPGSKIQAKHTFRVKGHNWKKHLVFFKTRTKNLVRTLKRFSTLQGFSIDRVTQ